jgi:hypothetical protein
VIALLVGVPALVGGFATIGLGVDGVGPWLGSPTTWLGLIGSAVLGVLLVRDGRISARQAVAGFLVDALIGLVGLMLLYVLILVIWVVPNIGGPAPP